MTLVRFVLLGIVNTLLTGALFFLLSFALPSWMAYSFAFGCGILIASFATPRVAFRVAATNTRRAAFAGWYVIVYLVGLGVIRLLESSFVASRLVTTIVTIATTAALSFVGASILFASLPQRGERGR